MAELLLQTKLFFPPQRPSLIPCPRLTTELNEGMIGKLTLASAPAGFGKAALISTWLNNLVATIKTSYFLSGKNRHIRLFLGDNCELITFC